MGMTIPVGGIRFMKHCAYCGKEYPDNLEVCPIDGEALRDTGKTPAPTHLTDADAQSIVISKAEQHFWERMTFREFAIVIVRLQALWILFPAIVELTYLPGYLSAIFPAERFNLLPPDMRHSFELALLRIALRVIVTVLVFQNADRLLSWLAKDLVSKQSPTKTVS